MLAQTCFFSLVHLKQGAFAPLQASGRAQQLRTTRRALPPSSVLRPAEHSAAEPCKAPCAQQNEVPCTSTSVNSLFTPSSALTAAVLSLGLGAALPWPAASAAASVIGDVAEGLETPVQLLYLLFLLSFLVVGAFLVVRQVLIRRELEEATKVLGERVRVGEATSEDYFELGVILLRKKLFTQATKNLEKAKKGWEGEEEELAQVHNALGYSYFNMEQVDKAIEEYKAAVQLQPGYVTAWNNLGDAYERQKKYGKALEAYREALAYSPDNKVAQARADYCKTRVERTGGLSA